MSLSSIACKPAPVIPIQTISSVYIPDDTFVCKGPVAKPSKVIVDGKAKYRDSDVGRFINGLAIRGDDCETKLHSARDIYNRQIAEQNLTPPTKPVDSPKP